MINRLPADDASARVRQDTRAGWSQCAASAVGVHARIMMRPQIEENAGPSRVPRPPSSVASLSRSPGRFWPDALIFSPDLGSHLQPGIQSEIKMVNGQGGRRVGAGRPLGSVNRATLDAKARLSELARQHCGLALDVLASIAENGQSETARIAAACALLDRGYGKPREASASQYADPDDTPFGPRNGR